jgi:nucleotidyltransferase/DNA polymerase involved in DNA repair
MGQRAVDDQLSREDTFVVGSDRGEVTGVRLYSSQLSDVRIAAAGVIAAYARTRVFEELGYTCSAGVAHCKMLAKLASARNKPKKQTLVPARSVGALLATLPVQKIRFLGSKLGRQLCAETIAAGLVPAQGGVGAAAPAAAPSDAREEAEEEEGGEEEDVEHGGEEEEEEGEDGAGAGAAAPRSSGVLDPLEHVTAGQAQGLPLHHLRRVFGDAQGGVLYALVRGVDDSVVVPKVRPKGMMAAKSVSAGTCATFPAAVKWLRMLSFELADRLAADDAAWQRTPKTFTLHFKRESTGESRSRSGPMPAKPHTQETILEVGTVLLRRAMEDERPATSSADLPCSLTFLSLGVSNFVEYGGVGGLEAYFKPGPDRTSSGSAASRKAPAPRGIAAFLLRPTSAAAQEALSPGDTEAVIVLEEEEEAGGASEGSATAPAPPRGSVCPICGQTIEGASAAGPRARDEAINWHVDACLRRPR